MKDKVFLDTNLFIYNFDAENKTKYEKSKEIVSTALAENNYVISYPRVFKCCIEKVSDTLKTKRLRNIFEKSYVSIVQCLLY